MKKTKLLTSLAALALVLSLGACEEPSEEETSEDSGVTTETTTEGETEGSGETSGSEGEVDDSDPVAKMFKEIGEGENYTLTIEYYDMMTDYCSSSDEAKAAWNAGERYSQDLCVQITYTEDAVLMEYYYVYYYYSVLVDVELYVNTEIYVDEDGYVVDGPDSGTLTEATAVYYIGENDELYLATYYSGHWQDIFWSALDLVSGGFPAAFIMGETTDGEYGQEIDYSFTQILANDSNMKYLVECLFKGGNYMGDQLDGPYYLEYLAGAYYYYNGFYDGAATYLVDDEQFDVELETAIIGWSGTYQGSEVHWYEYNYMCASISDVGTSVIPEDYASYLEA